MAVCSVCKQSITKKSPGLRCDSFCGLLFHANPNCSDVSKIQLNVIESLPGGRWACTNCRSKPADGSKSQRTDQLDMDGRTDENNASTSQFSGMINSLKTEINALRESVDFCSNKISDFEEKLQKINEYFKFTDQLKMENITMKTEINALNTRIHSMEQHIRSNNIEIHDVPEKEGENLINIVKSIANFINYPIEENMLDAVFRVPTKMTNKPKNIIVKFVSKFKRDNFLAASKIKRQQSENKAEKGFNVPNIAHRLFINEHLSTDNKLLLKQVRDEAKSKNYKFVWVQNGNILIRRDEKSKIIHITNSEDFKKL